MESRRPPISTILFLIITFMMIFAPFLESYPVLLLIVLIVMVLAVLMMSRRGGRLPWRPAPPDYYEAPEPGLPFKPELPRLGRWVIIPIAIIGVIAFILLQNWWLDVSILQSMYSIKSGLDWWKIQFLNNHYFYASLAIGLLIALSDPRVSIVRDMDGRRMIYLHSKFLGVFRIFRTLITRYTLEGVFTFGVNASAYDDKVPIKKGLAWKLIEFLVGAFILGPPLAQELALRYLIIARWIETQQISWINLLQRSASILWTRLFTFEMPTGLWLINNSPILEFLSLLGTPIAIFCVIWGLRFAISLFFGFLRGDVTRIFRSIVMIGLAALTPFVLQVPTKAFDITTPFYVRTMVIGEVILIFLAIFFSLRQSWVQTSISYIYRRKILLTAFVLLVTASLLYGPIVVAFQYAPAMEGNWKNWVWEPKVKPRVEYTQWATGLSSIIEEDLNSAINTGENLEILSKVRVFKDAAAKLRLKPKIGVNWMDLQSIDIILSNGREYWVSALTIVLPPTGEDVWRSERMIITHSERILAIDAASGEIVSAGTVFNISKPILIYYGEGGLFNSSEMVYIDIPGFQENHLPEYTGPTAYKGEPDYVLEGLNRFWFFSGIYGRESMRWDFARGDHGDKIKMLYLRDVRERISHILLPGMTVDDDPYLVSDGENLYFALYVYIDRKMPTEYLEYPNMFLRNFAVVLINTYNGSIGGYIISDENNYVLDFYRMMYSQWNQPIPHWLKSQLRYPEFLFERQINTYNVYHVGDPDIWLGKTDFFDVTTDSRGVPIEDVRYVVFNMNNSTYWVSVRLVQKYKSPALNLAAMYMAFNGEEFGDVRLLRAGSIAVIGPQTALDVISNYSPTKSILSLHPNWVHGNILMYGVNSTLYYFIPYYAQTETTLSPAMLVCIDALTQDIGYYVIQNPQDATEVRSATEKAYLDLVGLRLELGAEDRKNIVLKRFQDLGYTLKTPQQINPDVAFSEGFVSYTEDDAWPQTDSLITSFLDAWAKPYNLRKVLMWETIEEGSRILNLGVLVSVEGVVELHYISVAYSSG